MPADSVHAVHATLRAELGAEWRQLVTRLEPEPIGSATIAQVRVRVRVRVRVTVRVSPQP